MYEIKKGLIDGNKLGLKDDKKYIGVPWGVYSRQETLSLDNQIMQIKGKDPVLTKSFPDQYGRGDYILFYYEADFKPVGFGDELLPR